MLDNALTVWDSPGDHLSDQDRAGTVLRPGRDRRPARAGAEHVPATKAEQEFLTARLSGA
jgi:hypothetical protein